MGAAWSSPKDRDLDAVCRMVEGVGALGIDTCDAVHGHQQLSLFHAHYDTRCFLPVHVYHVESGKPVAVLLRPGKTPSGPEVRTLLKHLVRRIRRHWLRTRIVFRGDSHYGRTQAMARCEENGVDYIFGLAGNRALQALITETPWLMVREGRLAIPRGGYLISRGRSRIIVGRRRGCRGEGPIQNRFGGGAAARRLRGTAFVCI